MERAGADELSGPVHGDPGHQPRVQAGRGRVHVSGGGLGHAAVQVPPTGGVDAASRRRLPHEHHAGTGEQEAGWKCLGNLVFA